MFLNQEQNLAAQKHLILMNEETLEIIQTQVNQIEGIVSLKVFGKDDLKQIKSKIYISSSTLPIYTLSHTYSCLYRLLS